MRIALGIEYDGTDFGGWQSQANARSVQADVERAVARVAAHDVTVHAAGRTDSGVHALGQVAHFDSPAERTADQWLLGINSNLARDISIRWVHPVADNFDARRSAQWRRYVYLIQQGPVRAALAGRLCWWVHAQLDAAAMNDAAQAWLGERDFSAFRAAGCQSHTPMRCMHAISVVERGEFLQLEFTANAFLYHMVRNCVGTLVQIGLGRRSREWAAEVLAGRDRAKAGETAPACGLTLAEVRYDGGHRIPPPVQALWLQGSGSRQEFSYHSRS